MTTLSQKTQDFLIIAPQFQLGHLVTESFHPDTHSLSQLVKEDVKKAHALLGDVDRKALKLMVEEGSKIFMCGCVATGRLSIVLDTLFRQKFGQSQQIVSFMAG